MGHMSADKPQKYAKNDRRRSSTLLDVRPGHSGRNYWMYGVNPVLAAIQNTARPLSDVLCTPEILAKHEETITQVAANRGIKFKQVGRHDIDKLVGEEARHQGLIALVGTLPNVNLTSLSKPDAHNPLIVIALDQLNDPRNIGAIARTTAVFGGAGMLLTSRHAPRETAVMAKAASGALETIPMIRVSNLCRALETLKKQGYWVIGLDQDADMNLATANLLHEPGIVMVIGGEGHGLRPLTRRVCDALVSLPLGRPAITAGIDSLNAASAAAVALYAITNKRR